MIPGGFGPALAAAVMVRTRGNSVRTWLTDCLHWRVAKRWYAVALGLPVLLGLAFAVGISVATGTFEPSNPGRTVALYPVSVLALALAGGGQEEFGWRGYALPALQERWNALAASVAIGVVWAVWHLPAFLFDVPGYTGSFVGYALLVVGLSVVFTWLYNSTEGSVLLAMLFHGGINAASGFGALFVDDPSLGSLSPYAVLTPVVWVVAVALVARYGGETLADGSNEERLQSVEADAREASA
jgi:membrane protease YdiL (CAAX protease family)